VLVFALFVLPLRVFYLHFFSSYFFVCSFDFSFVFFCFYLCFYFFLSFLPSLFLLFCSFCIFPLIYISFSIRPDSCFFSRSLQAYIFFTLRFCRIKSSWLSPQKPTIECHPLIESVQGVNRAVSVLPPVARFNIRSAETLDFIKSSVRELTL
jgi:hypothetical protein